MRLEGKVALISGSARGMGAVEARLFAREGAKVVVGDLRDQEGRQVAAQIDEAGGGSIVNISSTVGIVGSRAGSAYGPSKGAVRLLTKYTALQHAEDQIRANSSHPGPTETDMIVHLVSEPEARAQVIESVPLRRLGAAKDIAYGALFLASDESSFMTGSELVMDGGVTAQ